jgi:hypothetical protein
MDPLIQILARLNDQGVEYVLIGAMAAIVYGTQRVTEDVDVCAPLELPNLQRIHAALTPINARFRFRPDRLRLYEDVTRLVGFKNLNLVTDWGVIDILGEVPGVGTYADVSGRTVLAHIHGVECRVLDLDALLASKRSAGRDKDLSDIRELEIIKRFGIQNPGLFDDM